MNYDFNAFIWGLELDNTVRSTQTYKQFALILGVLTRIIRITKFDTDSWYVKREEDERIEQLNWTTLTLRIHVRYCLPVLDRVRKLEISNELHAFLCVYSAWLGVERGGRNYQNR